MPDRTYKLTYVVDDSGAIQKLMEVRKGVVAIDYAARTAKPGIDSLEQALAALAAQAQGVATALPGAAGQINAANTATHSFAGTTQGLLSSWQVWEAGVALALKFGEYINTARERMRELAKDAQDTRDQFRELANLQAHEGPDNQVVAETIEMGMEAGMMPDDARRFMEQFEGSIPAGRTKGNIDKALEKGLAEEGMKFGTRVNLAPNTAGDLAGVLPQYGKIRSVEEGAGQMGRIAHGLNEGRGNLEPLVRSLIKTAGATVDEHGGPVEELPELAALLGVASMNATPDRAGTMVNNAVRGLRRFKGKQGETLQGLKISPHTKTRQALELIAPKIKEADASGIGGDTYMREAGFDNEDEIRAIVQFSRNIKVVQERIDDAHSKGDGKQVMAANRKFLNFEKAGMSRQIKARQAGMNWLAGEKKEFSEMGMQAGAELLQEEGQAGGMGNWARQMVKDGGGAFPAMGVTPAKDQEAQQRFIDQLVKEGNRVGIDVPARFNTLGFRSNTLSSRDGLNQDNYRLDRLKMFAETQTMDRVIEEVIGAGGKPFGTPQEVQARLRKQADADRARRAQQGKAPAAPPRAGPDFQPIPAGGLKVGDRKMDELIGETRKIHEALARRDGRPMGGGGAAPGRA